MTRMAKQTILTQSAYSAPMLINEKKHNLKKVRKCYNCKQTGHTAAYCAWPRNTTLVEKNPEQELASAEVMVGGQKSLIILSSTLPGDLFTEEALVVPCTLGNKNKINTRSLLDTDATGIAFIDKAMACHVCDVLKILFLLLAKLKPLKSFDEKPARPITHAIYPTLTVQGHSKLLAPMLVTSLGQHPIILGKPWMQKHGVILDISCDKFTFWPGHCQHSGARKMLNELSVLPANQSPAPPVKELVPTLKTDQPMRKEQATGVNTPKYVIPARKPGSEPAPKAALQAALHAAPQPLETKRAKVSKVILKASSRSAALSRAKKPTKPLELAMVGAAPFQYLTKQNGVEIFSILMQDLDYQLNKAEKPVTDPATVVSECYHEFLGPVYIQNNRPIMIGLPNYDWAAQSHRPIMH